MSNMKRLIAFLLLISSVASAQVGSPIQIPGGSKFKGGTLTQKLTMSDGTSFELATGSVTDLSLRFRTDTNTGIYSPSSDYVSFVVGGQPKIVVSSNEIIFHKLIYGGYSTSTYLININPVSSTTPAYTFLNDSDSGLGRYIAGALSLISDGVECLRVASDAVCIPTSTINVGIGTSTPDCALHVVGDVKAHHFKFDPSGPAFGESAVISNTVTNNVGATFTYNLSSYSAGTTIIAESAGQIGNEYIFAKDVSVRLANGDWVTYDVYRSTNIAGSPNLQNSPNAGQFRLVWTPGSTTTVGTISTMISVVGGNF